MGPIIRVAGILMPQRQSIETDAVVRTRLSSENDVPNFPDILSRR
jgi:hypothetical protein